MNYFTLPNILILFAVVFILFLLTEVKNYKSKNKEDEKEDLEEMLPKVEITILEE